MKTKFLSATVIGFTLFLVGCGTTDFSKTVEEIKGPPVRNVVGPYDRAKACMAQIPEVKSIKITVGEIKDTTGQVNLAEGGTGTFITQGATDMFNSTLAEIGVQLVELSSEYRSTVDWLGSKKIKGSIKTPQFVVMGSISALSFTQSSVLEARVFGAGPKAKVHRAFGRMDVRLVTLPFGKTAGGVTVAYSSVDKQFVAVEGEVGVGTFIGAGSGLTYASFRIGASKREPMQHAIGFMVDYASVDLVALLLEQLSVEKRITDRRSAIAECRGYLGFAESHTQVASAT